MRQNPHVRICGGPGAATTLVYPTALQAQRNDSGFPRGVTCTQDSHASQLKHPRSSWKALTPLYVKTFL